MFQGFRDVAAVYIRHVVNAEARVSVRDQRVRNHLRPQVGAADPNVDDIGDPFAVVALPRPAPHRFRKVSHLVQNFGDARHHVFAVHIDGVVGAVPQRDVQHGAVFGGVDLCARKHGVAAFGNPGGLRKG